MSIEIDSVIELLTLNDIDREEFCEKLYRTLLLGVFEVICKDIKKQNKKIVERELFRKRENKVLAAKSVVSRYVGCTLTDEGYAQIAKLLAAFFSTGDPRKHFDVSFRTELVNRQNGKCAICGKKIDSEGSHLDHIIPWEYVGDCLDDNYQMLCETCNMRKGSATYFELSMLLLKRFNKYNY